MVVGELAQRTEVVIIGGGPGGYAAALLAARRGKHVTLIERTAVGGTCLTVGCIPSKALLHAADIVQAARSSTSLGITGSVTVDLAATQQWMRSIVSTLTSGIHTLLAAAGVTVVTGTARFTAHDRVAVERDSTVGYVEFDHAIIATGSRPLPLPAMPFDGRRIIDSTDALALTTLPGRLVVVGGGYIGVELATAFAKLGSAVTIVEAAPSLLATFESSLVTPVARSLHSLGVAVLTSAAVISDDGTTVTVRDHNGARALDADLVLVAIGRTANVEGLGVDLPIEAGRVVVDAHRRVRPHLYAIGDITDGPALAHKAMAEAHVAVDNICGVTSTFDPAAIASIVFSDPAIVSVGHTTTSAAAAGLEARSFRFPLSANGRAVTMGSVGHVEIVAETSDGRTIGVHMVGRDVAELAGEATLAIEMATSAEDLAFTIHPHPTLSEAIGEAALGWLGAPLHVIGKGGPHP